MPKRLRTGFTLVELLVVIAILSILAGILFPALNRANTRMQIFGNRADYDAFQHTSTE